MFCRLVVWWNVSCAARIATASFQTLLQSTRDIIDGEDKLAERLKKGTFLPPVETHSEKPLT